MTSIKDLSISSLVKKYDNVITINPEQSILGALNTMINHKIKSAPIYYQKTKNERIFKILELTDIVKLIIDAYSDSDDKVFDDIAFIANNSPTYNFEQITAFDVASLSQNVAKPTNLFVSEGSTLGQLVTSMEEFDLRRVVVINKEGEVVNVVTQTTILQTLQRNKELIRHILKKSISELHLMTETLWKVSQEDHVIQAFRIIIENRITSVPVIEKGVLVGYITIGDIINVVKEHRLVRDLYISVRKFLDGKNIERVRSEYTCFPDDTLSSILDKMCQIGLNNVWVVNPKFELLGVVSFSDLLRSMVL